MSTKRAFLIERNLTEAETAGFLAVLNQHDTVVYLTTPNEELEKAGAQALPELSGAEKKAVNERILTTLNSLGHTQAGKDTVAGHLAFNGFPTWYYHKFRINYGMQPRLYQLEKYRKLQEAHTQVAVYTQQLPPLFLRESLVGVTFVTGAGQPKQKAVKNLLPQLKQMGARFFVGAKQAWQKKNQNAQHLFVLNHAHVRPLLDPDKLPGLYEDNVFVGYFLKEWSEHFLLIDKQLIEKKDVSADTEVKEEEGYWKRPMVYNEWIEEGALLNPLILLKIRRYHKHLKKGYKRISKALKDPLQKQLFREVEQLHASSLYFYYIFLAYRRFFKANAFRTVTLLDEYSPNFRAIVDAARQEGVRTQAIQHGSLVATNPGYSYIKEDERFDPWPDLTLVWGDHWKQLLIEKAAYPPERVKVTGQIRTDVIPKLLKTPLQVSAILGPQTESKFLILFASQPQPDESIRRQAALDVFKVASEMPGAWVVLKPHPREKDTSYYEALAQQAGCTNYSIHYDADLFLLLRLCHVLVHCYSTVGIEAVYFGLPAVILDYLNLDAMNFAAEEVALQALNADELKTHLVAIKQKEYFLDEKKKQAYIQKYACAVDGKVSERTAQFLLS